MWNLLHWHNMRRPNRNRNARELEFACSTEWEGRKGKDSTHSYSRTKNLIVTQMGEFFQEQFILVKLRYLDNAAKVIDIFVYLFLKGILQS